MVMGDEGENPVLEVVKARSLYTSEAQWLGLRGIVMATGLRGEIWEGWEGAELITWPLPSLNGWDLLAMETVRLIHTTPLGKPLSFPGRYYPSLTGPSTKELVARVTNTIRLVTEMLKSDWSLSTELQHITSQTLHLLQRCLSLSLSPSSVDGVSIGLALSLALPPPSWPPHSHVWLPWQPRTPPR